MEIEWLAQNDCCSAKKALLEDRLAKKSIRAFTVQIVMTHLGGNKSRRKKNEGSKKVQRSTWQVGAR